MAKVISMHLFIHFIYLFNLVFIFYFYYHCIRIIEKKCQIIKVFATVIISWQPWPAWPRLHNFIRGNLFSFAQRAMMEAEAK